MFADSPSFFSFWSIGYELWWEDQALVETNEEIHGQDRSGMAKVGRVFF